MRAFFKKIIFLCLCGNADHTLASSHTSYTNEASEKLGCTATSRYFAIDIPNFTIDPIQEDKTKFVRIHLHLKRTTFPVFYDRPIRKIAQTAIEDILGYLYCTNKRDLTLTLMLNTPLENKSLPLAFRVHESTYHAGLRKIEFIAELVESPALEFLKQASFAFKGNSSSLLIDG